MDAPQFKYGIVYFINADPPTEINTLHIKLKHHQKI